VAIELFHCGSLVHDDLPCFDDAAFRRGRASVHAAFGEPIAVLAGDALIAGGFEVAARSFASDPARLGPAIALLASSIGASRGLIAGQAWESEPTVDVGAYHRAKTGALFEVAAAAGALVGGLDPEAFRGVGACFGEAYQVLDDIADATAVSASIGKPTGKDAEHARPSAVGQLGLAGAIERARDLIERASSKVPACKQPELLHRWIDDTAREVFGRMVAAA
jgi:geranylgeranyl diphosphate synthase type II